MTDLLDLSARACFDMFARKKASPVDLLEAVLAQIDKVEPLVNAFALVDRPGPGRRRRLAPPATQRASRSARLTV